MINDFGVSTNTVTNNKQKAHTTRPDFDRINNKMKYISSIFNLKSGIIIINLTDPGY